MPTKQELANAIRFLSIDAVQKANSGHPGMPMGMADIAEVLWNEFLHHNPNNPHWINRDRFVLSNGHGSMLQYSLLHLAGYKVSLEDLKNFRQLHSITPGHPEYGMTPGIETTTGPLGQGLANAVGMAIAEKILASQFNRDKFNLIDHYTYVFLGDGCLMEGISHEVCSLAGVFGLGKLIAFWDDNHISIDGNTDGWFVDDTPARFRAYDWHVITGVDGHNASEIHNAIKQAQAMVDKPTLICCKTTIGFGSPNKGGTEKCHGSPLGEYETALVREELNWSHQPFIIPKEIYAAYDARKKGEELENTWQNKFNEYKKSYLQEAKELERRIRGDLPENWDEVVQKTLCEFADNPENIATRKASQKVLESFGSHLPEFLGGSADLSGSNLTIWSGSKALTRNNAQANYIHYGVREFGMSAIMNGIALYGGFIPYGGTFLVFYSYAASAVRMAAMMKQRVIFVYTHDSIGLGEDGPTHQPVEQTAALRTIPNMSVWRPCDHVETLIAWQVALERKNGPTSLLLSRQGMPAQIRDEKMLDNIKRGGYVLVEGEDGIILATGSEIALAVEASKRLKEQGKNIRVVSIPSIDIFLVQDKSYRDKVLPPEITARVAVEAAVPDGWYHLVGSKGAVIGMNRFGDSAPAPDLFKEFGFTVEHIVKEMLNCL
ncbi:MAG: transketolase [Gammaproteobacteria bacterium]|jgi:transketolase